MSQPSGAYHLPVLRDTVIDSLGLAPGKRALDATLGGGGHALALASAISPGGVLIGLDRDIDALRAGAARLASVEDVRVHLHHATYDQIDSALDGAGVDAVDAILMDLGVSSYQLDTAARGFAIRYVGPLDMRAGPERGRNGRS